MLFFPPLSHRNQKDVPMGQSTSKGERSGPWARFSGNEEGRGDSSGQQQDGNHAVPPAIVVSDMDLRFVMCWLLVSIFTFQIRFFQTF